MPRLAATVILVRQPPSGTAPLEVFMLRRSARSAFAPDVYVFPGGTLDEEDTSEPMLARMTGASAAGLRRVRPTSTFATPSAHEFIGLQATALRELFEESGVLLARTAAGDPLPPGALGRVQGVTRAYQAVLEDLDAFGDAGALALFSRWITPPDEVRRYDAYFFAALAPTEQRAIADALETHDGIWITPRAALARMAAGSFKMIYPTIKHVERLATFGSALDFMAFAAVKTISTVMPRGALVTGLAIPDELENTW